MPDTVSFSIIESQAPSQSPLLRLCFSSDWFVNVEEPWAQSVLGSLFGPFCALSLRSLLLPWLQILSTSWWPSPSCWPQSLPLSSGPHIHSACRYLHLDILKFIIKWADAKLFIFSPKLASLSSPSNLAPNSHGWCLSFFINHTQSINKSWWYSGHIMSWVHSLSPSALFPSWSQPLVSLWDQGNSLLAHASILMP